MSAAQRTSRIVLGAVVWLPVGCVAVVLAAAGQGAVAQANRAAAAQDAALLVGRLVLPAGALGSLREPARDGRVLSNPGSGPPATPNLVDRHRFWIVPGGLQTVLRFIEAHVPKGSRLIETGSGGGGGRPSSGLAAFSWPPRAGVLGSRWLVVSVVGLPGGATGLRADAQVVWISPRPHGERVPRGARVLDVSVARPQAKALVSIMVTNRARVHAVRALLDRLPIAQPGAVACPSEPSGAPVVTFTFRGRQAGPALARASEPADVGQPATSCDAMSFVIRGHGQSPLLAGRAFLRSAQRVLGVKLARPS